ncbi:MAG TPA: hypothetical protein PK954_03940, partial [Anaerolineales bacterium]|nr:hypothetical protein [Anaerolineales bacterium]
PLATAPAEATVAARVVESEPRVLELEYPLNLNLASSTDVRLSLVPDQGAYEVVQEQPDGTVITRTVEIPMPPGYAVFAGAHLLGASQRPQREEQRDENAVPGGGEDRVR